MKSLNPIPSVARLARSLRGISTRYLLAAAAFGFGYSGAFAQANPDQSVPNLAARLAALESLVTSLSARISQLSGSDVVIWSGGSSTLGNAEGWNTYNTDRSDLNTASTHLSASAESSGEAAGEITVLKAGFYRINFRTNTGTPPTSLFNGAGGGIKILRYPLNTTDPVVVHFRGYFAGTEAAADVIWHFAAGDKVKIQVQNTSSINQFGVYVYGKAFFPLTNNTGAASSRLQIQFLGE